MTAISSKFPTGPICHPQFFSSKDLIFWEKRKKNEWKRVSKIAFLKNSRCFKIQRLITTFFQMLNHPLESFFFKPFLIAISCFDGVFTSYHSSIIHHWMTGMHYYSWTILTATTLFFRYESVETTRLTKIIGTIFYFINWSTNQSFVMKIPSSFTSLLPSSQIWVRNQLTHDSSIFLHSIKGKVFQDPWWLIF